jgi:adhesin/invasin
VTFVAGPPSDALSTVLATPITLTADGTSSTAIAVTILDAQGNPVPGVTVGLLATGSGNSLTQGAAMTDVAGLVTATLSSTVAESKVISATLNGSQTLTARPTVIFTAGPVASAQSSITASPAMTVADGTSPVTLSLTARDAHGNAVAGQAVVIGVSGAGNQLGSASGMTNASGQFSTTLASTRA